jgi:hypothetical protein
MRCQVACALRGVNTCDGIVQGCFREKLKSMVQGARAEAKGEGEIVVTDLSRTSGTSGTSALVPSRRIVPGRSLRSRTKILEPLLAAWGGLEILHVHVTMYDSGSKVHPWRRLDRDLPKAAPTFCCMCPREAMGPAAVANNALYQRNNRRHLPTMCKGMQMPTSSIPKAIPVLDGLALENNIRMQRLSPHVGKPGKDQATRQGRSHLGQQRRSGACMRSTVPSRLSNVCQISLDPTWWLLRVGECGELSYGSSIGTMSDTSVQETQAKVDSGQA